MTSRSRRPAGLPVQLSSFVGRSRELAELDARFAASRLLTLTGTGGSGKTRLALRFADSLDADWTDPYFVDLAPVSDPSLVFASIAAALGIREQAGEPLGETIATWLDGRRTVLILDNLEQLPAAGSIVAELLRRSPELQVLATSRAPLGVQGEQEYPVNPLSLPEPGDDASLDALERCDSVRLFVDRSRAIDPGFVLTRENAAAVAEICARLDGLPLAIELAAYRTRLFSPASLRDRLQRALPLLTGGPPDAPARQRALHAAIAWSFDLLSADDQPVFARLGVFVGAFSLPGAAAVVDDPGSPRPAVALLAGIEHLVQHNLLRVTPGVEDEPRFRMLETIREFALEQLAGAEQRAIRDRHLAHYLELAEEADRWLRGPDQARWIRQLVAEQANVRAALVWARESGQDGTLARFATALKRRFWYEAGGIREGLQWLEVAMDAAAGNAALQAKALHRAGWMAAELGDRDRSRAFFEKSLATADAGDDANRFEALMGLGYMTMGTGGPATITAEKNLEEAIALARGGAVPGGLVEALIVQGHLAKSRGDGGLAWTSFDEAVAAGRDTGDAWGTASALQWLGGEDLAQGKTQQAVAALAESARLSVETGDREVFTYATLALARALTARGDLEAARAHLREGHDALRSLGTDDMRLVLLVSAAGWLVAASVMPAAVAAWAAAEHRRDVAAWIAPAMDERANRLLRERARRALGPVRFATLWARGEATSLPDAVETTMSAVEAVDLDRRPPDVAATARSRHDLTPREGEVIALVAAGLSDGEIAEALVISRKTASVHVANIKGKLGATSRVEIARMALRLGLDASEG
jgi:predicted ATPase/DNA-binding NarL/FixJ family response regulator